MAMSCAESVSPGWSFTTSLSWATAFSVMPLGQVLVGQHEVSLGRIWVCPDVGLQGPELAGVGLDVGIHPAQGRPVPAGSDREDRVERRGGLVVLALGEVRQGEELVHGRVIGRLGECLLVELEGLGVVARLERLAGLVERRGRLAGDGLLGRRGGRADRLGVIGAACAAAGCCAATGCAPPPAPA